MKHMFGNTSSPATVGRVLHNAAGYDLTMWLFHFGRERAMREDVLRLAALRPVDAVLDVGCGTGSLAIAAKKAIGTNGSVNAIDASPEMLVRARSKAKKARVSITFETAIAESLPFATATFDVVFCTIMLHHLPKKIRLEAVREIRRVLKPEGRAIIVDFQDSGNPHGIVGHFRRHRHGHVKIDDMLGVLEGANLKVTRSGQLRKPNLYFVIATRAGA